ncbi:hypothetical protein [Parachlamydia acanthamoebae]|uniref:hypothetical protein n=1 Tax=Parachlamydia acanthamoebae TaxID=83552 RepID=UPI00075089F4|nr:hypothetical protein [Parachlamydia acanthamoebae]
MYILINRYEFTKVFSENINLIQTALKQKLSAEEFIEKLERWELDFPTCKNHLMTGILLGYGVHNSSLFAERLALEFDLGIQREQTQFFEDCDERLLIVQSVNFAVDNSHPKQLL